MSFVDRHEMLGQRAVANNDARYLCRGGFVVCSRIFVNTSCKAQSVKGSLVLRLFSRRGRSDAFMHVKEMRRVWISRAARHM